MKSLASPRGTPPVARVLQTQRNNNDQPAELMRQLHHMRPAMSDAQMRRCAKIHCSTSASLTLLPSCENTIKLSTFCAPTRCGQCASAL